MEFAEPKQPIADQGAHQQADDVPPSGDVSGDSVPRASPLRASITVVCQRVRVVVARTDVSRDVDVYCLVDASSTVDVLLLLEIVYVVVTVLLNFLFSVDTR